MSPTASSPTIEVGGANVPLVEINPAGEVVLVVTFENSKSTILAARRQASKLISRAPVPSSPNPTPKTVVAYRARVDVLKKTSKYFEQLLGTGIFKEGRDVTAALAALQLKNVPLADVDAQDLPRIAIGDDDEATKAAGRETVFGDLLRILHGDEMTAKPSIAYLASLAVMADRFDCAPTVGRYVRTGLRAYRWPATPVKPGREHGASGSLSLAAEEMLRQKILIAWTLDQPVRLAASTKELILRGSAKWVGEPVATSDAVWWDLPEGLEAELFHRRGCILTTISSLQTYFLRMYTARKLQCKMYYDTSQSCDSFQLGQMIKFFLSKNLLHLTSRIAHPYADDAFDEGDEEDGGNIMGYHGEGHLYKGDIEGLIATLKECPNYQIDKNHTHCGLRNRIIAPLEYIQTILGAGIGIERKSWIKNREAASWYREEDEQLATSKKPVWRTGKENEDKEGVFLFTRSVASGPKMDGLLAGERLAKELFTAKDWDWSPEIS